MFVGVNGVGKTTTIGKLANILTKEGKKVIIGAADTFRAAAIEQLSSWADRVNVPIVKQKIGSDPHRCLLACAHTPTHVCTHAHLRVQGLSHLQPPPVLF